MTLFYSKILLKDIKSIKVSEKKRLVNWITLK